MIGVVICPKTMENWPKETLLCQDHKIHVRLKTYNKPEIISGFINKLTFLLTYKMGAYNSIEAFLKDYEIEQLIKNISDDIPGCEGIKILHEYSKINPDSKLGYIEDIYRASHDSSFSITGLLAAFQATVKYFLSIKEILFNDNISIILSDVKLADESVYLKFAKKIVRKHNQKTKLPNVINLWEEPDGDN